MKLICLGITLFLMSYTAAQVLYINVYNEKNEPLPGATVSIYQRNTSNEFHMITDSSGAARFSNLSFGDYIIRVRFIGYNIHQSTVLFTDTIFQHNVILSTVAHSLKEVTVIAPRPLIRQEEDKTIIDPEPIAQSSTNALEIIESTPGIYVDPDGGIFLTGATPAAIYINGREQKMSQQDLNYLLRSIPPSVIERIEIIRTPSAKYDAATSGGIVNIILKKGFRLEKYGTISGGTLQGARNNTFASASFNDQFKNNSYLITLNSNINSRFEELNTTRTIGQNMLQINSSTTPINKQAYLQFGFNNNTDKKLQLNYDGRITFNNRKLNSNNDAIMQSETQTPIYRVFNKYLTTTLFTSTSHDIGLVYQFDTIDNRIDQKISFSLSNNTSEQNYTNTIVNPVKTILIGNGDDENWRYLVIYQNDITYMLPLNIKLEAGTKNAYQKFKNNSVYSVLFEQFSFLDTQKTVRYSYFDFVSAGYMQLTRQLVFNINLKTGIRCEHTYMKGNQYYPNDTSFLVDRIDWFPYIYLSRKIFERFGIKLFTYAIYRRTITRPDYNQLNPSIRAYDQFFYDCGNPKLLPQFSENIEWNISFNDFPVLAIGMTKTSQIFSQVTYQHPQNPAILVRTFDNLGNSTEHYLRGIVGIPPGKAYFFGLGAQYTDVTYNGVYGQKPFQFNNKHWRFFTFHSLRIFKNTKITAFGFYLKNFAWNFYQVEDFGQLNMNISQTFLKQQLTISINVRDVFYTNKQNFVFEQGDVKMSGLRQSDTQRFGINIRYNFGIRPKTKDRNLLPDSEEISLPE